MAQNQLGALRSDSESFIVFTHIWQKDVAKISEVPRAVRNVNPARAHRRSQGVRGPGPPQLKYLQ